ncbi:MAG: hypothetical protein EZS28_001000 [Streblomastix strix]|uniref:Uncharacterized protein n=1 Tax=Streblomastix strix TaxID=222440 RepID=A0A5J4X8A5_9EUKA|nr:MAG: hypothetical protein EZS28_001000 [Streblomastix strix]
MKKQMIKLAIQDLILDTQMKKKQKVNQITEKMMKSMILIMNLNLSLYLYVNVNVNQIVNDCQLNQLDFINQSGAGEGGGESDLKFYNYNYYYYYYCGNQAEIYPAKYEVIGSDSDYQLGEYQGNFYGNKLGFNSSGVFEIVEAYEILGRPDILEVSETEEIEERFEILELFENVEFADVEDILDNYEQREKESDFIEIEGSRSE